MSAIEHDDFDEYVHWLEHIVKAKPSTVKVAHQIKSEYDADGNITRWWINDQSEEAVAGDIYWLYRYGQTCGLYASLVIKRQLAAQRRVDTMRQRKASGKVRDSQRQKLYDAQDCLTHQGRQFTSIEEMQIYADKLTNSAWWKRRYPGRRIIIEPQRNNCSALARGDGYTISMPKWAWNEMILLHEIAHHAKDRRYGHRGTAAHGREFAKTMLELVRHKMGDECWWLLKESFRKHKVKHTLPRKPMSEEQRAAASERLAASRKPRDEAATSGLLTGGD